MNNKGLVAGGLIVLVVVIVGLIMWANRANAPVGVNEPEGTAMEQDLTGQEYPAGSVPAAVLSPVPVSPSPPAAAAGTVKEFAVVASEFKFSVPEMRVKQGDTVRVTLTNGGAMPHDWRVDEFGAATKVISKGQTDTVEFVASKKGTFEYYCSVGQHRANGMVGKLVVE
ncbi:MAG: cupredoxin domain-containing protein [Patescibacteria group bacterium]